MTDFGLSRVLAEGNTHRITQNLGTISHTAPEALAHGKVSPPSDVYSFGIMSEFSWGFLGCIWGNIMTPVFGMRHVLDNH